MPATMSANPISDLMYDWLTVLHSKAEGLHAYDQYIQDAERENATECVRLLHKLHRKLPYHFARPIHAAAVNDNHFISAALLQQRFQRGPHNGNFVQHWDNDGNHAGPL